MESSYVFPSMINLAAFPICFHLFLSNIDNPVKSIEIVMPDFIPADHGICDRHPERIEITGFRLSPE
ncbi:MAG: hypothetical protein H8D67_20205 [Deltaproteobacteria bacterium]|nr:hypothetical protein [Deltaproteobacteria bacterium]